MGVVCVVELLQIYATGGVCGAAGSIQTVKAGEKCGINNEWQRRD